MKTITGKADNHGSICPPSEYSKVCDLTIPRWIRFNVNFILALILLATLHRLRLSSDFVLAIGAFAVISRISIYLHEKCHQVVFEKLTEKPAIICITRGTPNCRPTAPCSIPAYLAAQIFPLITTATLGVITSVLYIFNASLWIIFAFILTTIHSFLGSSVDLYWAFKLNRSHYWW